MGNAWLSAFLLLDDVNINGIDPLKDDCARQAKTAKTEGNWIGTYGTEGYDVIGNAVSLPPATPRSRPRVRRRPTSWPVDHDLPACVSKTRSALSRIADCWYSSQ